MPNTVREIITRANPLSFFSRLFNIAPSQWTRVVECWLITFFFKVGAAIGATIITSAFIARFGIVYLPILLIVSALIIIMSTTIFERLILRMKREVLMMAMLFAASLLLLSATFFYESSPYTFFALIIFAESIFLAQFNIFIPILIADRFTPLESPSTFPFIESGETIGGIIGASIIGFFGASLPVAWFIYIWIAVLICAMMIFILTSFLRTSIPKFSSRMEHAVPASQGMREIIKSIRTVPFLKSLVIIVLLQWVFMNFLDFQFTKSVEQTVSNTHENTIVQEEKWDPPFASILQSQNSEHLRKENDSMLEHRTLTPQQQAQFSEKLGKIKGSFHAVALIVQALVATRLIGSLGVVGSMLLHPIIMLMSLVGMFLKFGLVSSTVTRMNFEITNVIYKNAYFASHYALPKSIRDQGAAFLEGIARPLGTVISMILILIFQLFISGVELSMSIHISMAVIMFVVLILTIKLQSKYTDITREQLFSTLPYPEKLNAIEILAQKGHRNAPAILVQKLLDSNVHEEASIVRVKILSALGEFSDYRTLPEILDALSDQDASVRLEAAHALMNFNDVGEKFYAQAFSKYRMVEALKETFRKEKHQSVRSAIIRVFSILRQSEIVPFLLEQLKDEDSEIRADCIHTLGLFHDPNAAYYILPSLNDAHPNVRAAAIISLWQFAKYRPVLEEKLMTMLMSDNYDELFAAIYCLGEIQYLNYSVLLPYLHSEDPTIVREAAFALTKCGIPIGFTYVLDHLLSLPQEQFNKASLFINRLTHSARQKIERFIVHLVSHEINALMHHPSINIFEHIDTRTLEKLRRYYALIGQYEELYEFECALKARLTYGNI